MVVAVFQVSGEKSQYKKAENIYVVNDSSKLLLRYLIVLNRSADLATISKLLEAQYMKNHNLEAKQKELVNHRMQVRINTDMNKIKKMSKFVDIEQDSNTYFIHFDIGYMVTFAVHFTDNYPFEPPLIFIRNPIVNS
jgi:hypothetical protein